MECRYEGTSRSKAPACLRRHGTRRNSCARLVTARSRAATTFITFNRDLGHCNAESRSVRSYGRPFTPFCVSLCNIFLGARIMRTQTRVTLCALLLVFNVTVGAQTYKTLYSFTNWEDGENPYAGLTFDAAGNLYGVSAYDQVRNGGSLFRLSLSNGVWQLKVLHKFDGYYPEQPEGASPIGGLVVDEAGNVYGTTSWGRRWYDFDSSCGSVFKVSQSGFTYLRFFNPDRSEGCWPDTSLTYGNGLLWGTTGGGGLKGQGTVFSMGTSGDSFHFNSFSGSKGSGPSSAFSLWGYGTTCFGGGKGKGNIYRLDPVKGLISKFSFKPDGKAGYCPVGDLLTLVVRGVRTIYGTTTTGGVGGGGTVYRLTEIEPNSERWRMKVLHSFATGSAEGWEPWAGLASDGAGNLYGTTYRGGETDSDCGTVFKLSPGRNNQWTHTVLYSFDYNNNFEDGCGPASGVVLDAAGNLYGTTVGGGEFDYGAIYEIIP